MKAAAIPFALLGASALAMSVATVIEDETPPSAPHLLAKPPKSLWLNWTPGWESQAIYESTDLTNWTLRETLPTNAASWQMLVPIFTDEKRFFRVATLTNQ